MVTAEGAFGRALRAAANPWSEILLRSHHDDTLPGEQAPENMYQENLAGLFISVSLGLTDSYVDDVSQDVIKGVRESCSDSRKENVWTKADLY